MENSVMDKSSYDTMMDTLAGERKRLERELKQDYRNARRYIRVNPEKSVTLAYFSGIVTGVCLTILLSRKK